MDIWICSAYVNVHALPTIAVSLMVIEHSNEGGSKDIDGNELLV